MRWHGVHRSRPQTAYTDAVMPNLIHTTRHSRVQRHIIAEPVHCK